MLAMSLAGITRVLADSHDVFSSSDGLAKSPVVICHAGHGEAPNPADPQKPFHDCCDLCALSVPVLLSAPPTLSDPRPVSRVAADPVPVVARVSAARAWTPRQAQGPPRG